MTWIYILLCAILLIITLSLVFSFKLTKRHSLKNPADPADLGLTYKLVHFNTTDGIGLTGWFIPASESTRTIIFLHGFAGSMDPDLKYVRDITDAGYNVLMFDFRAHGRSGGKSSSLGALEVQDVLAAIHFARDQKSEKIGLLGFSMGGRTALLTAAVCEEVDAVISDGGPLRLLTAVSADMRRRKYPRILADLILLGASLRLGCNLFRQDPIFIGAKLRNIPILLIHGGQDCNTLSAELDRIIDDSGGNIQLWVVPEAGHRLVDEVNPKAYIAKVIGFFDQGLTK